MIDADQRHGVRATALGLTCTAAKLCLDHRRSGHARILADALAGTRADPKTLCSAATAEQLGPSARPLVLPWHKPITLGRVTLALTPSGAGVGTAAALVHTGVATVLDLRWARPTPLWPFAPPEVPQAEVVILDAGGVTGTTLAPDALYAALQAAVDAGAQTLAADDPVVAAALAAWLRAHGRGCAVSPRVAATLARWQRTGLAWPQSARRPAIRVSSTAEVAGADWRMADAAFSRFARGAQVAELARLAGAREVLIVGQGALALADQLLRLGIEACALRPQAQLPLV